MLSLNSLNPKMLIQFRSFLFQNSHELIYLDFQVIEIASIQIVVLIIHQMLKDSIANKVIFCYLQYVFTEIVHALKIAIIWMIIGECFQDLDHLYS